MCLLSSRLKEKAFENLSVIQAKPHSRVSWICRHLKRTSPRPEIALFVWNLWVFSGKQEKKQNFKETQQIIQSLISHANHHVLRAVLQLRWSKHAKEGRLVGKSLTRASSLVGEKILYHIQNLGSLLHLIQLMRNVWRVAGAQKEIIYALLIKAHILSPLQLT